MIIAIASTVFSIAGPKILGQATTKLFEGVMAQIAGTGTGIDFDYIGRIILITLGLYLVSSVFSYIQGWIMSNISMDITYRFRRDIAAKINRMPLKYFDSTSHGEVLSRITNDVDTVSQTLNQSLSQIITSVVTVVGVLVMMLTISWQMTLVALLIVPLSMVVIAVVVGQSQKYFKQQQDYLGHVNGHVEEMYGGHIVMKAFNGEADSVERFDGLNNTLYGSAWKSQFLSGLMMPIMGFVGNLGYVGICILGGYLAIKNAITVGDIQAFIQYVRSFTQPITQIANISNILQQTAAAAERVFEFLNEAEEVADPATPTHPATVEGRVDFKNVHFGYNPEKIIINDFSFYAEPGQKIAIVGPTGRRQDHHGQAADALLRCQQRRHPVRWPQHPGVHPRRPALHVRHGLARYLALQRHHHGKHPLRTRQCHGRASLSPPPKPPTWITLCARCPMATTLCSTRKPPTSRRGKSSS